MIDPINSLAFSMHANKGVYAMLLGSGISRASKIPTGWEITLELVRKVAAIQGEWCEPAPAAWYVTKSDKQPDYAELLMPLRRRPRSVSNAYVAIGSRQRLNVKKEPSSPLLLTVLLPNQ